MSAELYIEAFIIMAYVCFISLAIIGFLKLKKFSINALPIKPQNPSILSIVVSARNEEETIVQFIQQIEQQIIPKEQFELILIDDASNDKTFQLAEEELKKTGLHYQLIKKKHRLGKKKNIAEAIKLSKGAIIITTDADVIERSSNWLQTIANYFDTHTLDMLIMPLDFENEQGFLSQFQIFENLALTGITAGYVGINAPFLCNGANLAFKKTTYELINGYSSHEHLSSGEDVFLLESFKKVKNSSIHYLFSEDAIIKTKTENKVISFFNQRVRWASKAKYNCNWLNMIAGILTILSNFMIIALFVSIVKTPSIVPYLSIFVFVKLVFDFLLLFLAANFLNRLYYLRFFIPITFLYWLYAIIIGVVSLFYKPYWKGEKIN